MAPLYERLCEALAALHDLRTGKAASVFVDQNGERVEYVAANRRDLAAYVSELESDIKGQSRPSTIHFVTSKGL